METQTQSQPVTPLAVGIRYGLLLAVTWVLVDFLVRIANFSFITFGIAASLGGIIVSVVWVARAHKAFKEANGGLMRFGQGMVIALVMLLMAGVASGLFSYVYLHFIDPDFVERMKTGMVEFMERNNVPDDQIEKSTARMDDMKVDLGRSLLAGLGNGVVLGLIVGAVVTAFTKRNPPEFE